MATPRPFKEPLGIAGGRFLQAMLSINQQCQSPWNGQEFLNPSARL